MWKGNGWWEGILRAGFHVPISQSFITLGLPGFISYILSLSYALMRMITHTSLLSSAYYISILLVFIC